jgi:hypothetical protein
MTLGKELGIKFTNPVSEISGLLGKNNENVSVSISWTGQRLVSFTRYPQRAVDINLLVKEFLNARPTCTNRRKNLKARLEFCDLWIKMKKLCQDNRNLNKTRIYRFLVPIRECLEDAFYCGCIVAPRNYLIKADVKEDDDEVPSMNDWCFSFYERDFRSLWPNQEPEHISWRQNRWVANRDMVEEAYGRITGKKK